MKSVHRRQFIIGRKRAEENTYQSIDLSTTLTLSFDRGARLRLIKGKKSGGHYILLGYAIQSAPVLESAAPPPSPEEQLREEAFTSVESLIDTWAGRWALITDNRIYTDICGMYGLYYANSEEYGPVLSSSAALMQEMYQFPLRQDYIPIEGAQDIDFYPGPSTILTGVKRLMNTQYLAFDDGVLTPRPREGLRKIDLDKDTLFSQLNHSLINYMKNCYGMFQQIYLPLSGGYDSRSSGAVLIKSGVPFSSYTCIKKKMADADRYLPARLCAEYGVPHQCLHASATAKEKLLRYKEFNRHTLGICIDRDREYFTNNQHPAVSDQPSMIVGGGIWELGKDSFAKKLPPDIGATDDAESVFKKFHVRNPFVLSLLNDYIAYVRENPLSIDLPFSVRFYFEQRIGCWLSCIEQALDLIDGVRLQPLNSALMLSLYLSLPRDYLKGKGFHEEIIRTDAPKWMQYPFNQSSFRERASQNARRLIRGLVRRHR